MAVRVVVFTAFILFPLIAFSEKPNSLNQFPFEVLHNLEGSQKGDNVQGVGYVRAFLQRYGYLSHNNAVHDVDDFDDQLESALRTYQLNYNLQITGVLDADTIDEISKPRCGVPDIINGTTRMRSGQGHHQEHDSLHTVSHYSFFPGRPRWSSNRNPLTWALRPGGPAPTGNALSRAYATWATVTPFGFRSIPNFGSANMRISFEIRDHGDGAPFDGPGGVIAHAFAPTDGRFHYDGEERYADGAVRGAFDLETVALHEIGHNLGLGHSSIREAVMTPAIAAGTTKRNLHPDDRAGIRDLYNIR